MHYSHTTEKTFINTPFTVWHYNFDQSYITCSYNVLLIQYHPYQKTCHDCNENKLKNYEYYIMR